MSLRQDSLALLIRSWLPVGGEIGAPMSVVTWLAGLNHPGRWSPRWPVLPALAVPRHRVVALRSRLLSGKRPLSLDAHQWLARCAARPIRASPVR
jgi:hypothetical protein